MYGTFPGNLSEMSRIISNFQEMSGTFPGNLSEMSRISPGNFPDAFRTNLVNVRAWLIKTTKLTTQNATTTLTSESPERISTCRIRCFSRKSPNPATRGEKLRTFNAWKCLKSNQTGCPVWLKPRISGRQTLNAWKAISKGEVYFCVGSRIKMVFCFFSFHITFHKGQQHARSETKVHVTMV